MLPLCCKWFSTSKYGSHGPSVSMEPIIVYSDHRWRSVGGRHDVERRCRSLTLSCNDGLKPAYSSTGISLLCILLCILVLSSAVYFIRIFSYLTTFSTKWLRARVDFMRRISSRGQPLLWEDCLPPLFPVLRVVSYFEVCARICTYRKLLPPAV